MSQLRGLWGQAVRRRPPREHLSEQSDWKKVRREKTLHTLPPGDLSQGRQTLKRRKTIHTDTHTHTRPLQVTESTVKGLQLVRFCNPHKHPGGRGRGDFSAEPRARDRRTTVLHLTLAHLPNYDTVFTCHILMAAFHSIVA